MTFFEGSDDAGRTFDSSRDINNMQRAGFNNRASSVVVRGERWEVCVERNFGGRCVILRQGNYPSLAAMGLNDSISSHASSGAAHATAKTAMRRSRSPATTPAVATMNACLKPRSPRSAPCWARLNSAAGSKVNRSWRSAAAMRPAPWPAR
ncbi:beta/gamma crystallin-related protein [Roseateles sp. GG27B]